MRKSALLFFAFFGLLLLVFSSSVANAAKDALITWAFQVVPVLFPFFLCADMIQQLYGGSLSLVSLFLMSMVAGAPAGARLSSVYPLDETSRTCLCAALNATGPMFIVGSFCVSLMGRASLCVPILLGLYCSALFMLFTCRHLFPLPQTAREKPACGIFQVFSSSIYDGVQSMLSIGGAIVAFGVFLAVIEDLYTLSQLPPLSPYCRAMLSGLFEFVSGSVLLSKSAVSYPLTAASAAFLFSFCGLCVTAQSMRYVSIRLSLYFKRKLLQAGIAALIAYLFAKYVPLSNPVFASLDMSLASENALSALGMFFASALSMGVLWLLQTILLYRRKRKSRP